MADAGREVDPARVRWVPDARRIQVGREPVLLRHDRHFAWVWKPSGFLAVPAPGRHHPSVVRFVERALGAGLAVHRLDEGTSGVMLVARDETSQLRMKELFEVHAVFRRYIAIVRGRVDAPFTASSTLVRDRGDGKRGSGPGGKPATTHVAPLQPLRHATLIEAQLETGRTHQVRIHLSERGHALLGDPIYGDGQGAPRLALHAATLGFVHPFTGERIQVDAPLADDLEILRRRMG